MAEQSKGTLTDGLGAIAHELPTSRLKEQTQNVLGALGERAMTMVTGKVGDATERLTHFAEEGGGGGGLAAALTGAKGLAEGKSPLSAAFGAGMTGVKEKVKGIFGGGGKDGGGKGGKKIKVTNIVESIDLGVPVRTVYNQWTQYADFPTFMKKVENVDQESETETNWKAQVFWSHRQWKATIVEQVPDERIIWRAKGDKGHVDGAITFHELTPDLTRILLVLEYHPQGLFEHTGNLWRAQGRRVRLELKHFRRQVMTQTLLHPEEVEGWRGEIRDGEVVTSHEDALKEEEPPEDEYDDEEERPEGEYEDAYDETDEEPPDEEPPDEEPEDEEPEDEEPEEPVRRRRASAAAR
ncbi:SRPBCC family protein [Peterkaempfera bronchialis]|uniref:SRPBCC family protein n=1 Tax=Peterkaempfera bronchialis TaxID=2126346 RepID=UPI00158EF52A|nr:SRPBCC family protein [Peterkaempfera bronchialis]